MLPRQKMATTTTISYSFDRSRAGKFLNFRSESGTEFTLVHELTWTSFGKTSLELTIQSSRTRNKSLAVVEVISGGGFHERQTSVMENCAGFHFPNVDFTKGDSWRCLVSVVPLLELLDLEGWTSVAESALPSAGEKVEIEKSFGQLSSDWRRVLQSGEFSDVVLSDGIVRIKAYKCVLAARSPVFARMFQHGMRESTENLVTISDVAGNVLTELVGFLYTGTVSLDDSDIVNVKSLYAAADKYAVHDLKSLCRDALKRTMACEDVLETIALADLHGDEELKSSALDFASRCYPEVKKSERWERFASENKDLAIEVLSFVLEKKT